MKGNEPFGSVADPDPDWANQAPARADAVAPPTAVPKVASAAAATYSTTNAATEAAATDAAATEGAAATGAAATAGATASTTSTPAAATAAAATTARLRGCVSGRDQQTRYANGGKTVDAEQRGCCQTARQEIPSPVWLFPGHFIVLPDTL